MTAFLFLSMCFHAAAGLLEGRFEPTGLVSWAKLAWGYWRTQSTCLLHLGWNKCDDSVLMDWQDSRKHFWTDWVSSDPLVWGDRAVFEAIGLCCTAVHNPDYLYVGFCQVGLCAFLWALGGTPAGAQPCLCARGMHLVQLAGLCHQWSCFNKHKRLWLPKECESHMLPSKERD